MAPSQFKDGAIEGFDLAGTLRQANALWVSPPWKVPIVPRPSSPSSAAAIASPRAWFENKDLKMLAPLVRVNGAGIVDLPPRSLDYQVEAKLVGSLEGQGGDEALAGLPIPIHASGPWDSLTFDIDWKTVLERRGLGSLSAWKICPIRPQRGGQRTWHRHPGCHVGWWRCQWFSQWWLRQRWVRLGKRNRRCAQQFAGRRR